MLENQNRLTMNLQFFSEEVGGSEPSGVESTPAAVESQTEVPLTENETGVDNSTAAESEKEKQNNFEKAFAKRLAAERQKWEEETSSKFQNYDDYKTVAEFLREQGQFKDILSAKEAVELERLQQRAAQQNVSPDVQKRIEELETKAAQAEAYEKQQQQQKEYQDFRTKLDEFAKEKDVNPDDLHNFMYENKISNFDVAFRAMKFEDVHANREQIKKEAIQEYLDSKKAPKVEKGGTAGATNPGAPKSWEESKQRALERFRSQN